LKFEKKKHVINVILIQNNVILHWPQYYYS